MLKPLAESRPPELDRDWRRGMADAHFQAGESAAAIAVLEGHVGDDPGLALLLARAQHRNGQPAAAVATLQPFAHVALPEGAQRRPLQSQIRLEYARGLVAAADWPGAVAALEAATRLDPENAEAWQILGQALQASGRGAEAQQAAAKFQELMSSRPAPGARDVAERRAVEDPTGAKLQRGLELVAGGNERQGLALIAREVELATDDIRPRLAQTTALLRLKRLDEALAVAQATLRAFPGHPDALYQRGAVQMARQEPAEAEKDFRRALEVHPEHGAALNDLAVLLITLDRGAEARPLLERALAVNPDDPVAKANLERLPKGG
jgi:Flp pilus assembly protein TadD